MMIKRAAILEMIWLVDFTDWANIPLAMSMDMP